MLAGATKRTIPGGAGDLALIEAGDASQPTAVFLHGYPDTKELWNPVLERLMGRFHLIAYDTRGAGESAAPRGPAAYDLDRLADDFEAVLGEVAPERPVHLVGHDWGGIAGWDFLTSGRFEGRIASLTTIAGPSLDHIAVSMRDLVRRGRLIALLEQIRRSWYVGVLCAPGGPTIAWRAVLGGGRWTAWLRNVERVPTDAEFPAPTLTSDAVHGSNLYRRNIPRRMLRPRAAMVPRAPVQVIIPSGDHYISRSYHSDTPNSRTRILAGSHWSPRAQPELVARWVEEFAHDVQRNASRDRQPWVRGGGPEQLRGALALVTGAASGIGRASAEALAARGAHLLLVDRDGSGLAATAERIPGSATFVCDVSDAEAMERLVHLVITEHGVPDVVLNNAGIAVAGPFVQTAFEDWRRVLDVNVMGVVHGSRLFGRAMIARGEGGQIVNTASAAAFQPSRELPAYAASKAAVLMLSECLRAELGPHGIGVTAVCPGFVATNITRVTRYVGRSDAEQQRLADYVTRIYERRNFTAERVAEQIVEAIGADKPVAVITPEARLMQLLSRFAPGVLRRLAAIEGLPV